MFQEVTTTRSLSGLELQASPDASEAPAGAAAPAVDHPESETCGDLGLNARDLKVIEAIQLLDHAHHQKTAARRADASATTRLNRRTRRLVRLGSPERIRAIFATGLCHDAAFYRRMALSIVLLDAVLWYFAAARMFL